MNTLWGNVFKNSKKDPQDVRDILKGVPIFEELSGKELFQIGRILHEREYQPDEAVFRQGDPGVGMYIIAEGVVEIRNDPSGQVLTKLEGGEFFGELSLLEDAPRTASAVTRTPCRLLCFFQPDLLDLINRHPRLGVKILFRLAKTIGERLRKTNECLSAAGPASGGEADGNIGR
ncbi:MAG: cyclic nucleotide-binding domain-containing protein [Nitrospiraceae bacterium]|nr:cyclic nucleotide-binding domain-containing protein [Nitrospiraceae bacterium]